MHMNRLFPRTPAGVILLITSVALLALACTALSVRYQGVAPLSCMRELGAGFPLAVICDSRGGSPISGWGTIDESDIIELSIVGVLLDVLFYALLACGVLYSLAAVRQRARSRPHQE